jgi:hypothetical protein
MTASFSGVSDFQAQDASAKTSAFIAELARQTHGRDVSLGEIIVALKDRGFGIFMILFALPNAIIPGLSFLLGAPVLFFALQLAAGRGEVWLPGFLQRRMLPAPIFTKIVAHTARFLTWTEKRVQPRWSWLVSGKAEQFLGLYIALVTAFLMTPVPFGNALPALGISLMSAGLIEKDGKTAAIGILLGLLGVCYIAAVIVLGFEAAKAALAFL